MISPDNPCFGCHTHRNGKVIKAPCCHDSVIIVDSEEYPGLFLSPYLKGQVEVEESFNKTKGEMYFYIYLLGKCPHLTDEGLCGVEEKKPKSCSAAQPKHFRFCIKSE